MSQEEILREFQRGNKSWESSQLLLESELYEDALSRAYYAVLHSAKAVLMAEGIQIKSHRGVRRLFGQHLVKPAKIKNEYAKILNTLQDLRFQADYDAMYSADRETAQELVSKAEKFLDEMRRILVERGFSISEES